MAAASLHAVVEALGALERRDLEEIALAYVRTHAQVCRLAAGTDHVEACDRGADLTVAGRSRQRRIRVDHLVVDDQPDRRAVLLNRLDDRDLMTVDS
jgi:hypothetical protein